MNWGHGIALLTLCFVAFMTFLVISAFRQSFDLVTEDYYGKELKFQSHIDKQYNHRQLKGSIKCELADGQLLIAFPDEFKAQAITGDILLFCPSDAARDLHVLIDPVGGIQLVDLHLFKMGYYRVQIDYRAGGKAYYFEQNLTIK